MTKFIQLGTVAAAMLLTSNAFAHDAATSGPLHTWSFEPPVLAPLLVAAVLFGMGVMRRRNRAGWSRIQIASFATGWITLFVALVTPVHALGTQLFSVHMTQHELLMIVAAPLLVLSRPIPWFLWALPFRLRESLGELCKRRQVTAVWSAMTMPSFVWLLHGATLWAWHIPWLYDASVEIE